MKFGVWGLGFELWGVRIRVEGLGRDVVAKLGLGIAAQLDPLVRPDLPHKLQQSHVRGPLSSECGTYKTIKPRVWPSVTLQNAGKTTEVMD